MYLTQADPRWAFRVRAKDNVGNQEAWHSATGDVSTTAYNFGLSGIVMDHTGLPVKGVVTTANVPFVLNQASQSDGTFLALMDSVGSSVTSNWQKTGYGTLPDTLFSAPGHC